MSSKTRNNHATVLASDQALIDGLVKHASTLLTLLVAGSTVKTSDLVTVLQARITAIKLAIAAKASFMAAVAAARDEIAKTAALASGARQALKIAFAGQVELLGDFGLKPPKARTPLTAEQKAIAKAKAQATRAANHPKKGKSPGEQAVAAAAATAGEQQAPAAAVPGGAGGTSKS